MRTFYITLFIATLYSCKSTAQSSDKVGGILLMSPWRTHTSFDVFLPCKIDTSISLTENLRKINQDTAFQTFGGDLAFDKQVMKFRNQAFNDSFAAYIKYCLLLPIYAEYDTAAAKLFTDNDTRELSKMTYTFNSKTVTKYYWKPRVYLKNIKVLNLPKE